MKRKVRGWNLVAKLGEGVDDLTLDDALEKEHPEDERDEDVEAPKLPPAVRPKHLHPGDHQHYQTASHLDANGTLDCEANFLDWFRLRHPTPMVQGHRTLGREETMGGKAKTPRSLPNTVVKSPVMELRHAKCKCGSMPWRCNTRSVSADRCEEADGEAEATEKRQRKRGELSGAVEQRDSLEEVLDDALERRAAHLLVGVDGVGKVVVGHESEADEHDGAQPEGAEQVGRAED